MPGDGIDFSEVGADELNAFYDALRKAVKDAAMYWEVKKRIGEFDKKRMGEHAVGDQPKRKLKQRNTPAAAALGDTAGCTTRQAAEVPQPTPFIGGPAAAGPASLSCAQTLQYMAAQPRRDAACANTAAAAAAGQMPPPPSGPRPPPGVHSPCRDWAEKANEMLRKKKMEEDAEQSANSRLVGLLEDKAALPAAAAGAVVNAQESTARNQRALPAAPPRTEDEARALESALTRALTSCRELQAALAAEVRVRRLEQQIARETGRQAEARERKEKCEEMYQIFRHADEAIASAEAAAAAAAAAADAGDEGSEMQLDATVPPALGGSAGSRGLDARGAAMPATSTFSTAAQRAAR
jgi:hypothetical protein